MTDVPVTDEALTPPAAKPKRERQWDFGAGRNTKAWKDMWGAGQGVGAVGAVVPAAALVTRLAAEYEAARRRLGLTATSAGAE